MSRFFRHRSRGLSQKCNETTSFRIYTFTPIVTYGVTWSLHFKCRSSIMLWRSRKLNIFVQVFKKKNISPASPDSKQRKCSCGKYNWTMFYKNYVQQHKIWWELQLVRFTLLVFFSQCPCCWRKTVLEKQIVILLLSTSKRSKHVNGNLL